VYAVHLSKQSKHPDRRRYATSELVAPKSAVAGVMSSCPMERLDVEHGRTGIED